MTKSNKLPLRGKFNLPTSAQLGCVSEKAINSVSQNLMLPDIRSGDYHD